MTQNKLCPDHHSEYVNIRGKEICVVEWVAQTTEGKSLYDIRKRSVCVQLIFNDCARTTLEFRYVYVVGEDGCDTVLDDADDILNTLENLYVCDVSYIPAQENLNTPALVRMDFSINPDAEPLAYALAEFTLIKNWVDLEFNEPE